MNDEERPGEGGGGDEAPPAAPASPFRYHLELTPPQLKITHTALKSLLDDFGHEEQDVVALINQVLAKLPDEHAIRAIDIGAAGEGASEDEPGPTPPKGDGPPPVAA